MNRRRSTGITAPKFGLSTEWRRLERSRQETGGKAGAKRMVKSSVFSEIGANAVQFRIQSNPQWLNGLPGPSRLAIRQAYDDGTELL